MLQLMKMNDDENESAQTINRRKKKWGAEIKPGTHSREWRFSLASLRENNIRYPEQWDKHAS